MEAELGQQQGTPREPVRLIAVKLYFSLWFRLYSSVTKFPQVDMVLCVDKQTSHIKDFCSGRKLLFIHRLHLASRGESGNPSELIPLVAMERLNHSADHAILVNYARSSSSGL